VTLHPVKCTVWCATSKLGLLGLIFVEDTITDQQKLQSEVIPVAGHVDTTFFQQVGACAHIVNVFLDVLYDVFIRHILLN
jgi:hypothetical protein